MKVKRIILGNYWTAIHKGDETEWTDEEIKIVEAAPDLLEACEYAVNYLPDGHRFAKEKLQQAINKAKGEIK